MITFEQSKRGYANLWDRAQVTDGKKGEATAEANRINNYRSRYEPIERVTGVPWYMVGCIHYRESSFDFGTYLGNGDRLDRPTIHVPKDRGPFSSWEAGAEDALVLDGLSQNKTWTIERILYWLERFNGQGYFGRDATSPYLWSWTTEYHGGKFTADGVFSRTTWDSQGGCAAILKTLEVQGVVKFTREALLPTTKEPKMPTTIPSIDFAQIEKFVESAAHVLPLLSAFFPPLKVALPFIPVLEGLLTMAADVEKAMASGGDVSAVVAAGLHDIANKLKPSV